jgi:hypothetical protein
MLRDWCEVAGVLVGGGDILDSKGGVKNYFSRETIKINLTEAG